MMELIDAGITDREEIIRLTTPFVPQGHAYRVRESTNERLRRRRGGEPRHIEPSPSEIHRIGARQSITKALHIQVRCGYLVIDGTRVRRPFDPSKGAS